MTTYQIEILECPACHVNFRAWSVGSRNTFGATFYTDGFIEGPMYDEGSAFLVCPGCKRSLWREDIPIHDSILDSEYFRDKSKKSLPSAEDIHGARFIDILRQAAWKNDMQERYVRTRAWWAWNDVFRADQRREFNFSTEQAENLERLLELFDPNDSQDSIAMAEVLRELGRFTECLRQLEQHADPDLLPVAEAIRQLANNGNRRVAILK